MNYFGFVLCFLLPGVLIGMLCSEGMHQIKEKARPEKKRALGKQQKLFIYNLQDDSAA